MPRHGGGSPHTSPRPCVATAAKRPQRQTDRVAPLCGSSTARTAAVEVVIITTPAKPRRLKRPGSGATVGEGFLPHGASGEAADTLRCVEIDYENYLSWITIHTFLGPCRLITSFWGTPPSTPSPPHTAMPGKQAPGDQTWEP